MSSITLEIREDVSHREGGHAIILIKGLKTKPDNGAFAIEPADASLAARDMKGWPVGIRRPLKTTMSNSGFEIVVGPDVVECPVLLPGTPVVIKIPAAGVCEEALWPDITPLRRQKVKRIITSSERRDAIARAQSNVTSLDVAEAKPAQDHSGAQAGTSVPAGSAMPGARPLSVDAQFSLAQNADAGSKTQIGNLAGSQTGNLVGSQTGTVSPTTTPVSPLDASEPSQPQISGNSSTAPSVAIPGGHQNSASVGTLSAVDKLISGTIGAEASPAALSPTGSTIAAAAATLAVSATATAVPSTVASVSSPGQVGGQAGAQSGGDGGDQTRHDSSVASHGGGANSGPANTVAAPGSSSDRTANTGASEQAAAEPSPTGNLSKLSGYSKARPAATSLPSGNDNRSGKEAPTAPGSSPAASPHPAARNTPSVAKIVASATQSSDRQGALATNILAQAATASPMQKEDMLVAALSSAAAPGTAQTSAQTSAPTPEPIQGNAKQPELASRPVSPAAAGKSPAASNAPGLPKQPLNQSTPIAANKSSATGGGTVQTNPTAQSKLVNSGNPAKQTASKPATAYAATPAGKATSATAPDAGLKAPAMASPTVPAKSPMKHPGAVAPQALVAAASASNISRLLPTAAAQALVPTQAQPLTQLKPQPSISNLVDRLSNEPDGEGSSDPHAESDQPVPQVRNLRAERPSRRWHKDGWLSGAASGIFASIVLLYSYVSVAGWPNLTTIGLPPASAVGFVSQHGEGLAIYDALKVGTVSPRGIFASSVNADAAIKRADNSLRVSSTGGSRDTDESAFWFKHYLSNQIGAKRTTWALTQLGTTYASPTDGAPDFKKAQVLWEAAAALGDPYAACFLGQLYEHGLGVVMSRDMALTWYLRARSAGGCSALNKSIARLGG